MSDDKQEQGPDQATAIILDQIIVTRYMDGDGDECIAVEVNEDGQHSITQLVGMLEWAKGSVLKGRREP